MNEMNHKKSFENQEDMKLWQDKIKEIRNETISVRKVIESEKRLQEDYKIVYQRCLLAERDL